MPVLPFSNKVVYAINFDKPYTVFTNLWLCVKGYNLQENRQHFLKKYVQRNVRLTPLIYLLFLRTATIETAQDICHFLKIGKLDFNRIFRVCLFVCLFVIDWLSFANL